MMKPYIKQL